MTNTRETLIELYSNVEQLRFLRMGVEECVDILITNGVTVNKWIPVSKPPNKYGKYLTACENTEIPQIRLYEGSWDSVQKVTHWMPLPKLPNGG